jgi:hypothetical protein
MEFSFISNGSLNKLVDSIVQLRQVISSEINNNYELTKMLILLNESGFPPLAQQEMPDLDSLHLNDGNKSSN